MKQAEHLYVIDTETEQYVTRSYQAFVQRWMTCPPDRRHAYVIDLRPDLPDDVQRVTRVEINSVMKPQELRA